MAATTATPQLPSAPPQQLLNLESIARIDSTTLSQSELHALSLSSLSPIDFRSSHPHIVIPKIDPAMFNESAGSRRQTYSRPRRPQSSPTGIRRRVAGLLPAAKVPSLPVDDSENVENRVIIDYLKQFIREDPKFDQIEFAPPSIPAQVVDHGGAAAEERSELAIVKFGERKRKRGRKPKVKVHLDLEESYRGMEIVNMNGVAIDLAALAEKEDPFVEELRRRTEGLKGEEELLGFLSDLEGQWGSRRKKRRIVDAASFGDALPLGWKLLLGLKRKDGHAWVYCRRYMSPSGQQFVSCREVSSYLQSLLGHTDAPLQIGYRNENMLQEHGTTTGNFVGITHEDQDDQLQIVPFNSDVPISSDSNERLKEVALLGMENLADVEIRDLFECHRCNMTFDDKDSYLQHLLSFHQRITRRYRLGSSVGDGVIIKDGKFECQFCHKVFEERRRYNGHVGIHVRSYVRRAEDSPGQASDQREDKSPIREDVPLRLSKMDALIEIAQNSIMKDSVMEPSSEIAVGDFDQDMNFESPISEQQMEDSLTEKNAVQNLTQQDSPQLPLDGEVEEIDDDSEVIDAQMITYLDNIGLVSVSEQDVIPSETYKAKDDVALSVEGLDQSRIVLEGASHGPLLPSPGNKKNPESGKNGSSGCQSTDGQFKHNDDNGNKNEMKTGSDDLKDVLVSTNVQEKVGKQIESGDNETDNVKGFQELGLDEIGTLDYNLTSRQDSVSLPDVQTDMVSNTLMQQATYASAVQIESRRMMLNMDARNQLKTVCVWCGVEFNHDAANSEIQPDSVGFMCPACKAKISGQISVLGSGITEC